MSAVNNLGPNQIKSSSDTRAKIPNSELISPAEKTIMMSDIALVTVRNLMIEEEDPELFLRLYVIGGGCSGLQYGFRFASQAEDDDTVVTYTFPTDDEMTEHYPVVRLVVDPASLSYLKGAYVDYSEDPQGRQFMIKNPNATTTCSCGQSFSDE